MEKKIIICIMGPTAVGKSHCAMFLTKLLSSEIISVDSAAIYKGMIIGTATPDDNELQQVPHHLLHFLDPTQRYSAADFSNDATRLINNMHKKNIIPLLVGGTFLYFRTLLYGISPLPSSNQEVRHMILERAAKQGWDVCHQELSRIDPISAARIHPHDKQRIQRALEIFQITGKTLTELFQQPTKGLVNTTIISIGLEPPNREWLHQRIEERFHSMINKGFVEEVRHLYQREDLSLDLPAIRSVGYRQIWQYLNGEFNHEEMCQRCIFATRQLAKRQLTWLRHWPDIHRFDCQDPHLFDKICALLSHYGLKL